MKECVAGIQRTRPMEIQWQNERDGTIKRAALRYVYNTRGKTEDYDKPQHAK